MEQEAGVRASLGCTRRTLMPRLLCQGEPGIAIQHMEMALLDKSGVGGSEDVEIVDSGGRLAFDGIPVPLAIAGAVVAHDGFSLQADADSGRTTPRIGAQGFGHGAGAGELAPCGIHAEGEFDDVASQQHGGDRQERNLCSPIVLLEDYRCNYKYCQWDKVDRAFLWEWRMQPAVRGHEEHQGEGEAGAGERDERSIAAPPVVKSCGCAGERDERHRYARRGAKNLK